MENNSIKQIEVSEAIGVSKQVISDWCSGQQCPDPDQIFAIAKALHVTTDWLLGKNKVAEFSTIELKPCPFCGEKAKINYFGERHLEYPMARISISCEKCLAHGMWTTTEYHAAEMWNRRTDAAQKTEQEET